ncbi:hypothetical protein [Streptomyces sp. NPDC010273]|uniref:hypothetical protein n=1 Tax=Streptomyces sp. NPDC010273 TaxID=3364829 RepID=UPI0036E397D4
MVRNARIKILIAGQPRPYTEGEWVIFSPSAFPVGFMHVERRHLAGLTVPGRPYLRAADDRKAFADYWAASGKNPLAMAMKGYTIKLVPSEELDGLLKQHLGG